MGVLREREETTEEEEANPLFAAKACRSLSVSLRRAGWNGMGPKAMKAAVKVGQLFREGGDAASDFIHESYSLGRMRAAALIIVPNFLLTIFTR